MIVAGTETLNLTFVSWAQVKDASFLKILSLEIRYQNRTRMDRVM